MYRATMHADGHNSARSKAPQAISALQLRFALDEAAAYATMATAGYVIGVMIEKGLGAPPAMARAFGDLHADTLVRETEDLVERWCEVLGAGSIAAYAPISWAIQEIVEWIDASLRYRELGEDSQRVPITWRPTLAGDDPSDLDAIVDERFELLLRELKDYGVIVTGTAATREPASRVQDRQEVA